MTARFAGSKSLDERRRRRLVTEEKRQSTGQEGNDVPSERQLPTRRPTGRFPLRRVVSSSHWKLLATTIACLAVTASAVAAGQSSHVRSGAFGPGLRQLFDLEQGRIAVTVGGLLLLAAGQLAWLIRWARSRSLRDFRGSFRIWWWVSMTLCAAGVALLCDAHLAFASTIAWVTGRQLFGSDVAYQVLPATAGIVLLVPALQAEMRGCVASRSLMLAAVSLWVCGMAGVVGSEPLEGALTSLRIQVPAAVIVEAILLVGTATAFSSLLFHARHVVYESVEPPEPKPRKSKIVRAEEEQSATADDQSKTAVRKSRRTSRTSKKDAIAEAVAETVAEPVAKAAPVETPSTAPPEPTVAAPESKKPVSPSKPASAAKPPVLSSQPTPHDFEEAADEDEDADGQASINGRNLRLDGAEDLRGLSKRERRKLRKAMKDRERVEA
jgi:hypothetical protein